MMDKIKWFVMEQSFRLLLSPTFCANLKIGNVWNDIQAKMASELVMNSNNFWIMLLREVLKTVVFIECYAISAGSKFRGEES